MLRLDAHDDVTQLAFSTLTSRAMGFGVSAFLVRGVLVDSGFPAVRRDFAAWLSRARPAGALLTHWHEDHAGNADVLASHGVAIGMPHGTESRLRAWGHIGFYRRACWGPPRDLRETITPFEHPDLTLVPALGHSDDHHVVWDADRETVFGGDLFIGVKVRIAHHGEDLRAQVESLRRIAGLRPRRFFDAHRGLLPDATALLRAKADWIEEMIAAIEHRARLGWDANAIRNDVLGREDHMGIASRGAYSRMGFVRSVLDSMPGSTGAAARE